MTINGYFAVEIFDIELMCNDCMDIHYFFINMN